MKIIKIYTDGGYKPSIKIGAIAFLILKEGKLLIEYNRTFNEAELSNNKMEMMAVIKALNWLRSNGNKLKGYRVYLYTDSQYVQLGITEWLTKWKKDNWKNSRGKPVKNKILWLTIDNLIQTEFSSLHVNWIEGHNGDRYNERVDELCTISMKSFIKSKIEVNGHKEN